MSNMPEKTPEFWVMALAWLSQHSPVLYACLLYTSDAADE